VQLSEAAQRLLDLLEPDGVLIGGICGAIYGVERFTRDVDMASFLETEAILMRLKHAGIPAEVRRSSEPGDLGWVVHGEIEGIAFQVLPAKETGIGAGRFQLKAGLRVADLDSFIESKCIAGGQQDMHDVAALALMHPELKGFCIDAATRHGCRDRLQAWLNDRRLQQRYASKD